MCIANGQEEFPLAEWGWLFLGLYLMLCSGLPCGGTFTALGLFSVWFMSESRSFEGLKIVGIFMLAARQGCCVCWLCYFLLLPRAGMIQRLGLTAVVAADLGIDLWQRFPSVPSGVC